MLRELLHVTFLTNMYIINVLMLKVLFQNVELVRSSGDLGSNIISLLMTPGQPHIITIRSQRGSRSFEPMSAGGNGIEED